jgi:rare lipoprotein A (peptidoglycan hydrolase)
MTTMQIAFFKHALTAGLVAAFLGALAPLVAPVTTALAQTTGEATSTAGTAATPATGTTATGATPTNGSTPTNGATPAEDSTTSVSGGAAPAPASPSSGKLTRATWYGPGFYGHTTACGQKLTHKLVGVASRTLPCGTLVRISYRGHVLTAPVLDRGPFGNGATWDLTAGAAHALDIKETVRIGTQIVGSVPNTPALGEPLSATLSPVAPYSPTGASPAPLATSTTATPSTASTGGASAAA